MAILYREKKTVVAEHRNGKIVKTYKTVPFSSDSADRVLERVRAKYSIIFWPKIYIKTENRF